MNAYRVEWTERGIKCTEVVSTRIGAERFARFQLHRGFFAQIVVAGGALL
ncbi:MAG: hypothetical protein WKG52_00255 [Variovorax sp.]